MNKMLFLVVIASLLVTACGGAKPAAGPVEITFMMWGAPEELAVWQKVVDDF